MRAHHESPVALACPEEEVRHSSITDADGEKGTERFGEVMPSGICNTVMIS